MSEQAQAEGCGTQYECPLCGIDFVGDTCHSSCPMSKGCAMVRCPRCSYEFVPDGKVASIFRRFFGLKRVSGE